LPVSVIHLIFSRRDDWRQLPCRFIVA